MRYTYALPFLIGLSLLLAMLPVSCNRCWGSVHLSASVPGAVKPGQRIDFHGWIEGGCECGGACSVGVSCANGERTYTDSGATSKRGYCIVKDVPGGEFYVCASGSCQGPQCGPGDIPGSTGPLSECSNRAYIVSVPSFSVSASPTTLPKKGNLNVQVTGLTDDGKGTITVTAELGGKSYTLSPSGGTMEYDLRNVPAGPLTLTVTATKSYAGVTDSKGKSISLTLLGSKPSITVNIPEEIRRGDKVTTSVDEPDGDDVTAKLTIAGRTVELGKGSNEITIDLPKGSYALNIEASDVDGTESKSYTIKVLGSPPSISMNVPSELKRGEAFTLVVSEGDGDEVSGTLTLGGRSFELRKGENTIVVPADLKAGDYSVHAVVKDSDGQSEALASFKLLNQEPMVSLSVDRTELNVGDVLGIRVEASDDAPGLMVKTQVGDVVFEGTGTFEYTPKSPGNLGIRSIAVDMDGATSEAELSVNVKPSSPSGGSSSSSSSSSGGSSPSGGSSSPSSPGNVSTNRTTTKTNVSTSGTTSKSTGTPSKPTSVSVVIEVEPPEPYVGDEVTVRVITRASGLLQIIEPEGKVSLDTGKLQIRFRVDKPGTWLAKFIYKEGSDVKVVSKGFSVRVVEEVKSAEPPEAEPLVGGSESIRSFEASCIMVRSQEVSNFPWVYLVPLLIALLLIARRRVSG
ncbi:MAG: hypothetical protein QXH90_02300 [Candidatus Korarchaeum sp.]